MQETLTANIQKFWETNRSCMLVVASSLFSSAMALSTKLLELGDDGMDAFQILFIRMGMTTIWCTSVLCWKGNPDSLIGPKEVRGLLLLRGFAGFFGILGIWTAIKFLSLADASVVTFLTPSIVGFYSAIFLRQPYTREEQLASLVALAGVGFIARPSLLFGDLSPSSPSSQAPGEADGGHTTAQFSVEAAEGAAHRLTGILFALLSAFGGAGAFIAIRAIGDRCHVLTTTNLFAACCTLVSAAALTIAPVVGYGQPNIRFGLPHDSRQWFLVCMITICGFLAQWFLTAGLGSEKRSHKAPAMVYTGMLWTAAFDRFFLEQNMYWSSILGCALIVGSAVWVVAMPKPANTPSAAGDVENSAGSRAHGTSGNEAEEQAQELVRMPIRCSH
jgi:drug/metabolite transporter (DMT)-like permease